MADEQVEVLVKVTMDERDYLQGSERMVQATEDQTTSLEENTEATEEGEKATEDYSAATGALTGQLDKMTGGLASTTKGIFAQIKGWKSLKVAIAATGIGLILIAFSALSTAVSRLDGPMRLFEDILGGISVVTGELLDRFGRLGEALINLFTGNFKAAADSAKAAFDGLGQSIGDAFEAGQELARAERELKIQTAQVNAELATRRDTIQQLRTEAREEREDFARASRLIAEAGRLERVNLQRRIELEQQTQAVIQARFEASSKNYKDEIQLTDDLRESQERINAARAQEREFVNAQTEFNARAAAEQKARDDAERQRLEEARQAEIDYQNFLLELTKVNTDKEVEFALNAEEQKLAAQLKTIDDTRKANEAAAKKDEEETNARIIREATARQAAIAGVAEVGALVGALAGEGAKSQAIFQSAAAVARAWMGFLSVLQDPLVPFWGKFAAGAAVLSAGLSAAARVKQAYQSAGTEFALGGWLKGRSHAQGGIDINAEGGEYMVNKRSMANPVLAGIVEKINDYGNRQVMALGGFVGSQVGQVSALRSLPETLGNIVNQQVPVLVTEDLDVVQNRVSVTEDRSTLSP